MAAIFEFFDTIRDFLDRGGFVIVVIAWVIFVMWTLIIERILYIKTEHRQRVRNTFHELDNHNFASAWSSEAIRTAAISQLDQRLHFGLNMIRTLAAICPLLGLLGTVTGMIVIFDVMAIMGSSSPRAVASGVAQATMTTMAGMVGALSGVFPAVMLSRLATETIDSLHNDHQFIVGARASRYSSLHPALRLAIALGLALLITLTLVYSMQRLIETGQRALTDPARIFMPDFVRIQRDENLETKQVKPDKPLTAEAKPEIDLLPQTDDQSGDGIQVDFSSNAKLGSGITTKVAGVSGFQLQDADYLPLVKVAPIYPRRAEAKGLEGLVLLRFTVTTSGTVRDVEVVESSNSIFDKAAIQAVLKFKYKPRVVNGVPMEVTGVLHYIRFEIDE